MLLRGVSSVAVRTGAGQSLSSQSGYGTKMRGAINLLEYQRKDLLYLFSNT